MANLLEETLRVLENNGKTTADVRWVGDGDEYECSWVEFAALAGKTIYDNGFGGAEVAQDLKVVGDGWWLERHEYDGAEWWEFKSLPQRIESSRPILYLSGWNSDTLKELHKTKEDEW